MSAPAAPNPFRWTKRKQRAVILVAAGDLHLREVAAQLGITDRALRNWRAHPDFAARVQEEMAAYSRAMHADHMKAALRRWG